MNFASAFSFPFQDPDWLKNITIVTLISLIPVIGQLFLLGWALDITRRVIHNETDLVPDLDFGVQLMDGFRVWVASIVYALPIFVVTIPLAILGGSAGDKPDQATLQTMTGIAGAFSGLIVTAYAILLAFFLPAAYGNIAAKGELSAGLRFKEVFALVRAAPGSYLIGILGAMVTGLIAPLGLILCIVGAFLMATYYSMVAAHFYGQAYNEATRHRSLASPQVLPQ